MQQYNEIGMHYAELETPALLVDLAAMEHNLHTMADFFASVAADLRPHVKSHRAPALARRQLAVGAVGVCCGSLAEAEAMLAAGIDDVLITKEVVLPSQLARIAQLTKSSDSTITVIVDEPSVVELIDRAARSAGTRVGVLVDVDLRLGRSGVAPLKPAQRLARLVASSPGLAFRGLMGYEGSMHQLGSAARERECRSALAALIATKEIIEHDGIAVSIVSCGATSTYRTAGAYPGITEVQAGSYLLSDGKNTRNTPEFETALSVLTTVISRPNPVRVTIDTGQKKLAGDGNLPEPKGMALHMVALNEEHGLLDLLNDCEPPQVGDKLELIPWHGATTINLYDRMYAIRDGRVVEIWDIVARGA